MKRSVYITGFKSSGSLEQELASFLGTFGKVLNVFVDKNKVCNYKVLLLYSVFFLTKRHLQIFLVTLIQISCIVQSLNVNELSDSCALKTLLVNFGRPMKITHCDWGTVDCSINTYYINCNIKYYTISMYYQ